MGRTWGANGQATDAVLIAGPTASGKSALALSLAERTGGIVINADSMQVYRDLRIITARPTPEEEARVPHRLYGHVDASVNCSAGMWVADAAKALEEARAQNRLPIFVGGSGLYFKALTRGLSAVPPIPSQMRDDVRARLERDGAEALHAVLARRDPAAARTSETARPHPHRPCARSRRGDRALADRLASRWLAAAAAAGQGEGDLPRAGSRSALRADRRPLRCDAGGRRAGGSERRWPNGISIRCCRR